jgi:hypothetical protein
VLEKVVVKNFSTLFWLERVGFVIQELWTSWNGRAWLERGWKPLRKKFIQVLLFLSLSPIYYTV